MSDDNKGRLNSKDLEMFRAFGVGEEFCGRAEIERVSDPEARAKYGFAGQGNLSGIVFPYKNPVSGRRMTARLRRDHPELENGTSRNKYLCPYGDRRHLYFPPDSGPMLSSPSVPAVIVEAEKSALAVMALASRVGRTILAVACGGCWGWKARIGISTNAAGGRVDEKGPVADLAWISWESREAFIAFDSNASSNPKVRHARQALAQDLQNRGAHVRIIHIPELPNINGPDDFVGATGDEAFLQLMDAAPTSPEVAVTDAEIALAALKAEPDETRRAVIGPDVLKVVANVGDPAHRKSLETRTAKVLRWPTADVRSAVKLHVAKQHESAAQAKEAARRAYLRSVVVDAPALVADLETFIGERAYLPPDGALVLGYFALNTYTFDVFDTTPYGSLESATPGCGKNTVLNILEAICCRPKMLASATEATLFRTIDKYKPTVLLDEAESLADRTERASCVKAIAQAGYKKGGTVPRCLGPNNELQNFEVFCPKMFAAIGGVTGALLSRCFVIHMEKAPAGHVRKSSRQRQLRRDSARLRELLEAYGEQSRDALGQLYNEEPDAGYWPELRDREAELWGPLLTHARLISPALESRLLTVALRFSAGKQQIEAQDRNVSLAIELLEALGQLPRPRFMSSDLPPLLAEKDAWAEKLASCHDDRGKAAKVGRFLARFRLSSREHTQRGSSYLVDEAVAKLAAHIPERAVSPVATVSEPLPTIASKFMSDSRTDLTRPEEADTVEAEP